MTATMAIGKKLPSHHILCPIINKSYGQFFDILYAPPTSPWLDLKSMNFHRISERRAFTRLDGSLGCLIPEISKDN